MDHSFIASLCARLRPYFEGTPLDAPLLDPGPFRQYARKHDLAEENMLGLRPHWIGAGEWVRMTFLVTEPLWCRRLILVTPEEGGHSKNLSVMRLFRGDRFDMPLVVDTPARAFFTDIAPYTATLSDNGVWFPPGSLIVLDIANLDMSSAAQIHPAIVVETLRQDVMTEQGILVTKDPIARRFLKDQQDRYLSSTTPLAVGTRVKLNGSIGIDEPPGARGWGTPLILEFGTVTGSLSGGRHTILHDCLPEDESKDPGFRLRTRFPYEFDVFDESQEPKPTEAGGPTS